MALAVRLLSRAKLPSTARRDSRCAAVVGRLPSAASSGCALDVIGSVAVTVIGGVAQELVVGVRFELYSHAVPVHSAQGRRSGPSHVHSAAGKHASRSGQKYVALTSVLSPVRHT